ncbi:MAG: glycosyltransferase [Sphingomonadaceae bacterium]
MSRAKWEAMLPTFSAAPQIPKIIHQTYPTRALPKPLEDNVADLVAANPGWVHRLHDDTAIEQFIEENYPAEILTAYLRIKPEYGAARADLFRYLAVYALGGVYLDIKSRFTCPIDEVVHGDEGIILSQWRNSFGDPHQGFGLHPELGHVPGGEFQQWHIIAAAGHPFLRAVIVHVLANIDQYSPWSFGVGRNGVFRLTGPIAYTLAIHPLMGSAPAKIVASEADLSLEYSIAGSYVHQEAFKRHYSHYDTSILRLPLLSRGSALLYTVARRIKGRIESSLRR